ncbi:MAG: hypothetical protein IIC15_04920 [Thaumarchaeota archaeon]|nr:hypothetical protein [Nitrososphaerota archaeon]
MIDLIPGLMTGSIELTIFMRKWKFGFKIIPSSKSMNKYILLASIIAIAIVGGIISSGELVEAEKPAPMPAAVCPAENVQHWETLE